MPSIFDYASYIKHLDYYPMVMSVVDWLNEVYFANQETRTLEADYSKAGMKKRTMAEKQKSKHAIEKPKINTTVFLLMLALFTMFKNHGAKLTSLRVMTYSNGCKYDEDCYTLLGKSQFLPLVSPIRSLEVNTDYCKTSFLTALAGVCTNLDFLHVQKEDVVGKNTYSISETQTTALKYIIASQQSLKSLKLTGYLCDANFRKHVFREAIGSQVSSLRCIEFQEMWFKSREDLDVLTFCFNLEVLKFNWCWGLTNDLVKVLVDAKFLRLKVVEIKGCSPWDLKVWAEAYQKF
ncbi:14516_t:CDS:2 [Acaulospora colombiana]|uniref:14516_t:CDS:1 n=1 Tax=Acaulospora colombiana TaxID=27376 RepID=A0ACA9MAG6_9GLOM|nr:14516_t:CDS:2 [Acaulospora colombiana]